MWCAVVVNLCYNIIENRSKPETNIMTMNREVMKVQCDEGGSGNTHLQRRRQRRSVKGEEKEGNTRRVNNGGSSNSWLAKCNSSSDFFGVQWRRSSGSRNSSTAGGRLMQIGLVLLIIVNSIVLCSAVSISSDKVSSISKNTVLGAEGHDETFADTVGTASHPTLATVTTTESAQSGNWSGEATGKRKDNNNNNQKGGSGSESSSNGALGGYYSKGPGVRLNVSNNTTAPLSSVVPVAGAAPAPAKPKIASPVGKEFWNKQQKVASVLKGTAKKGKYPHFVMLNGWILF